MLGGGVLEQPGHPVDLLKIEAVIALSPVSVAVLIVVNFNIDKDLDCSQVQSTSFFIFIILLKLRFFTFRFHPSSWEPPYSALCPFDKKASQEKEVKKHMDLVPSRSKK